MRVLLTGATGFLGRRVAELLVAGGHDVVSIGRSGPDGSAPPAVRFIRADLVEAAEVRRAARAITEGGAVEPTLGDAEVLLQVVDRAMAAHAGFER